jgi:hypothetical protein
MRRIPDDDTARLWLASMHHLLPPLALVIRGGVAVPPGQDPKGALYDVMAKLLETAFRVGVGLGYDLGSSVFDLASWLNRDEPELAARYRERTPEIDPTGPIDEVTKEVGQIFEKVK